ncbi:hypothetical protein [Haliea sp.]|jgi:hypothetical protein|uniref:hypothetical protein n=1 Tax=Haliea sp. TaxID=1932666 RepID=UPI000C546EA0|nr:hypothetical protein [Haliea sp.]HBX73651.1 hypothetical protein [Halieaceae bacterium]MAD65644.1 hypothetical protein [Haliea sp.]MAY92559.1 hypothetical protein [Haliea sp.]MBK40660.1 hypothetical protein [Haliea sp.]MBP69889.1 hypothetical protein [Haliea sp.]|tara:strand:- start:3755 stop:4393 length:639 start_codon:yes stop_codon:yes gene_type:complete
MGTNVLVENADEIASRLDQLGVTEAALRESVYQGHLQRTRLTLNHPAIYHGLNMWGEVVAALRGQLRPLGWTRQEIGGFALTAHEEHGLAIAVASGDEATGIPSAHPSNRSKKGRNTVDAIEANRQQELFEKLPDPKEDSAGNQTWILMHHTDTVRGEIRLELSRPSSIGEDGKISEWSERIILDSIPFYDELVEIYPPNGLDIEIDIRRKA